MSKTDAERIVRNTWRFDGLARATSGLGAAGWAVSLIAARLLFG